MRNFKTIIRIAGGGMVAFAVTGATNYEDSMKLFIVGICLLIYAWRVKVD